MNLRALIRPKIMTPQVQKIHSAQGRTAEFIRTTFLDLFFDHARRNMLMNEIVAEKQGSRILKTLRR